MQNFWKIAPGRNAEFWRDCYENKCIAVSWLNDMNLAEYDTKEDMEEVLKQYEEGGEKSAQSLYSFVHEMKTGDIVVANDGRSKCKGIGVVSSGYLYPKHRKNPFRNEETYAQVRLVDWQIDYTVELDEYFFNIPTVYALSMENVAKLRQVYDKALPTKRTVISELLPITANSEESATQTTYQPDSKDERRKVLQEVNQRRGQQGFRKSLLEAYQHRCCVTNCNIMDILEAAHIHPYQGDKDNHVENGLLLRADIHTLFDLNLLGIDPNTLRIKLARKLTEDSDYKPLDGKAIRVPKGHTPSKLALVERFSLFQTDNPDIVG